MDNEGCGKIAAIVTAIAGLIAIFIFVTGKQNLPQVIQENQSEPVQVSFTPAPTNVPNIVPPTIVRQATAIPTPLPPPTSVPDTAPGTILQVGETWSQGGLSLTLVSAEISGDRIYTRFVWANNTSNTIVTQIGERTFRLVTSNNIELRLSAFDSGSESIKSGAEREYSYQYDGDLGNSTITEIIAIANISRITNARWRIPVYH